MYPAAWAAACACAVCRNAVTVAPLKIPMSEASGLEDVDEEMHVGGVLLVSQKYVVVPSLIISPVPEEKNVLGGFCSNTMVCELELPPVLV